MIMKKKTNHRKKNWHMYLPPPQYQIINLMIFFLKQDMSMHLFFWASHIYVFLKMKY